MSGPKKPMTRVHSSSEFEGVRSCSGQEGTGPGQKRRPEMKLCTPLIIGSYREPEKRAARRSRGVALSIDWSGEAGG